MAYLPYDIVLGVLTNVVSTVLTAPLFRPTDRPIDWDPQLRVDKLVAESAGQLAHTHASEAMTEQDWRDLLDDNEIRATWELMFLTRVDSGATDLEDVRSIFCARLNVLASGRPAFASLNDRELFDDLLRLAASGLHAAARTGNVAASDSRAEMRHKAIVAELAALRRMTEERSGLTPEALDAFDAKLREEVKARSSRIELPSTVRHEPVDIDALYVVPLLTYSRSPTPTLRFPPRSEVPYRDGLRSARRRVILGNPGAGKSTLATKMCYDIVCECSDAAGDRRALRIELRKYHASGMGLLAYCESLIRNDYLLASPSYTFRALLANFRYLIVFDGLDEILESDARRSVRTMIEAFARQFPRTDVIVTSRIVGYEEAPLNSDEFDSLRVDDFDAARVSEYVEKWFSISSATAEEARAQTTAFERESLSVDELRRSPLLLALLCALYKGQGFIPDNLPDIYEQCSLLLFQTWDKSRGIEHDLPFSHHIQPALQDLAFWMYSDARLAAGITERQAVRRAATYLNRWRFPDESVALGAAKDFVNFCRGRAWVFSDQQSTSRAGEDLFAFTHRTFLEYFAAMYLLSTKRTTDEVLDVLVPRITRGEWEVVCLITLQMHARAGLGGADELVEALIAASRKLLVEDRPSVVGAALQVAGAIVPSPMAIGVLARATNDLVLTRLGLAGDDRRMLLSLVESSGHEVIETLCAEMARDLFERLSDASAEEMDHVLAAELLAEGLRSSGSLGATLKGELADKRAALQAAARANPKVAANLVGVVVSRGQTVAAASNYLSLHPAGRTRG